jgi:hypothetical protein
LPTRFREEVLNVLLAECISDSGLAAVPESIATARGGRRALPDVLISFNGLRCNIEGKYGDAPDAQMEAGRQAHSRIENGVAHLAIGVVYPAFLRQTPFPQLKASLRSASLSFMVCTEASSGDWREGDLNAIMDDLRRAHDMLARDDVVERSVERLECGMGDLVALLMKNAGACVRLAETLGVHEKVASEA